MKQTHLFECILCKKFRSFNQLESLFKDGTPMCKLCGDEIRGSFTCCINGKEITPEEFKQQTKKDEL